MVSTNSAKNRTIDYTKILTLKQLLNHIISIVHNHFLIGNFLLVVLIGSSCTTNNSKHNNIDLIAEPDLEFNNLFTRREPGFTGGDGTYSVKLPDGKSIWIFGDTFIGPVSENNTRKKTNPKFIRNSFVLQSEEEFITLHQGEPNEFKSMMIPPEVTSGSATEGEIWYWPGDGFVLRDTLHVFVSKFTQTGSGMWDFKFVETALVSFTLPDIQEVRHVTIKGTRDLPIHFGHAVFETSDFIYIYGLGKKGPYVARTTLNSLTENWEYRTKNGWTTLIEKAEPMREMDGSEQFSVIQLENKIVYLTQLGNFSKEVYSYVSDTPYGPWSEGTLIYNTPVPFENENLITYNTVAHPQFNRDGKLLISYNTNSQLLEDHYKNAAIYKPRFARIPIEMILK
jgi:hypothetical protein